MKKFWEGLRQRHVFQVAAIYLIVGWIVVQVTVTAAPALSLPDWFDTGIIFLVILGFPIALVLAWAFEVTPDGIKKSSEVLDKAEGKAAVADSDETDGAKPSIAVMPFANLSDDKDTEHLADGMTEDIITGLSFDPHLSVVSRNAVFVYKDKPADLRDVGRDLGVRYVLEGSLRQVGSRVRVTAQLIETKTGSHIWAEKFDRPFSEIFDVQDEVIEEILGSVGAQLNAAEQKRMRDRRAARLDGWGAVQSALYIAATAMGNPKKMEQTVVVLRGALEEEPDAPYVHALLAFLCAALVTNGSAVDVGALYREAQEHLAIAVGGAGDDPTCLVYIGAANFYFGQFEDGIRLLRRALSLNPNDVNAIIHLGMALAYTGEYVESNECFARARRIAPTGAFAVTRDWYEGIAFCIEGRFEEAEARVKEVMFEAREYPAGKFYHGMTLALLGRDDEAVEAIRKAHALDPEVTLPRLLPFFTTHSDPAESKKREEVFSAAWNAAFDTASEASGAR